MRIRDIMTARPEFISTKATIAQALSKMFELGIRHLPILDEGELRGVVSDRDIRAYLGDLNTVHAEPTKAFPQLGRPVSEIMNSDPISLSPDALVTEAIDIMLEERFGALPVLNEVTGELIGIVSYVDILRAARPHFAQE
jgi:CBS domain-containing protein